MWTAQVRECGGRARKRQNARIRRTLRAHTRTTSDTGTRIVKHGRHEVACCWMNSARPALLRNLLAVRHTSFAAVVDRLSLGPRVVSRYAYVIESVRQNSPAGCTLLGCRCGYPSGSPRAPKVAGSSPARGSHVIKRGPIPCEDVPRFQRT